LRSTAISVTAHSESVERTSGPTPGVWRAWRTGLASVGVALSANLVVLGLARLAGADMVVQPTQQAAAITIGVGAVAATVATPMLVATFLLLVVRRWGARAWRALATTGLVIGVVTVPAPFTVVAEGGTQAALASMHVITGLVWFVVVRRAAARAEA